jgi:hypothetical protein
VNAAEGMRIIGASRTWFYAIVRRGDILRKPDSVPRLFSMKSLEEYAKSKGRKRKHGAMFKICD